MNPSLLSFLTMLILPSVLMVVTPTIASDYTLGIFGNANMDDTIDEDDVAYVEGIIDGTNEETELADTNYDGVIDEDDIAQIELIIAGEEKELTIIDSADRAVTIKKPVNRVIVLNSDVASAVKNLGSTDRVVGVSNVVLKKDYYFPELGDRQDVGYPEYDYEMILSLNPDLVINYGSGSYYEPKLLEMTEALPNITIVGLDFYKQQSLRYEMDMLGYILDEEDEAKEYNDWCGKYEDAVKILVDPLDPEDRPRVFIATMEGYPGALKTYGPGSGCDILCSLAGGINIAEDLPTTYPKVDSEWVISENPDVIITFGYGNQGWANTAEPENLKKDVLNTEEWAHLSAVENDRVYVCNYELLFGLDSVVGLTYWAKFLHPEFDLDSPEVIYREYYEMLNEEYPEDLIQIYPSLEVR
jgi:iron complex transport system substrate-binding protein